MASLVVLHSSFGETVIHLCVPQPSFVPQNKVLIPPVIGSMFHNDTFHMVADLD